MVCEGRKEGPYPPCNPAPGTAETPSSSAAAPTSRPWPVAPQLCRSMLLEARQELQGARHAGASRAEWAATLESDMAALHSIINARIDRLTAAVLHVGAHTIG